MEQVQKNSMMINHLMEARVTVAQMVRKSLVQAQALLVTVA
jgi:hypothetical protein